VSVDGQQEVDDQIASLLLRTFGDDDDDDDDDGAVDATFQQNASWSYSSVVDHTPSPSAVDSFRSYLELSVDDTMTKALSVPSDAASSAAVPRRRRTRHPHSKAAVSLLKAWYEQHRSRPYANDAEVQRLAVECQLRIRQVQKWLSNQRRMDGNTRRRHRPAHNAKWTISNHSASPSIPCSD